MPDPTKTNIKSELDNILESDYNHLNETNNPEKAVLNCQIVNRTPLVK